MLIPDGSDIGNFCIVGAGSVVSPNTKIPNNSVVIGIPAKRAGGVPDEQLAWCIEWPDL